MIDKIKKHPFGVIEYSYQKIFSKDDKEFIVEYLEKNFFKSGKINTTAPGYQTTYDVNLFDLDLEQFQKLKNTYIHSVLNFINQDHLKLKIKNNEHHAFCWCYLNWKDSQRSDQPFHIHNKDNPESLTGIFYLKLPNRENKNGNCETEFYLGGYKFRLPSIESSWFIFPSNYGHSPGKQEENQKRYTISADIYFPENKF